MFFLPDAHGVSFQINLRFRLFLFFMKHLHQIPKSEIVLSTDPEHLIDNLHTLCVSVINLVQEILR